MKKALFIAGLGLTALVGNVAGVAADSVFVNVWGTSDSIVETVFEEAGLTQVFKNDHTEIAVLSQEELPFENLYLFMYQNVKEGPQEAALEEVSVQSGYSVSTLEQILIEGDPSPLTKGDNRKKLTDEEVFEAFYNLRELYDKEYELQKDHRKLAYQAIASEIFMNNDESDSAGIDLLSDLDQIHKLMFNEFISLPDRSGEEEVQLVWEEGLDPLVRVQLASEDDGPFSPYACYEDGGLSEALLAYENGENDGNPEDALLTNGLSDYEATFDFGGADEDAAADPFTGEGDSDGVSTAYSSTAQLLEDVDIIPGEWTRELPCTDIFCVTVDLITEEGDDLDIQEGYRITDNCIACHVNYINDSMQTTLSKSLVPSKVSMNILEDATCKQGWKLLDLDLNVYTVKKPIILDPSDDDDEAAEVNIEELKKQLFHIGALPLPDLGKSRTEKSLGQLECEGLLNLADVGGVELDIEKALESCVEAEENAQAQIQEVFDEVLFEAQVASADSLYAQMAAELYVMLQYFSSFQEALENTYIQGQAPLDSLIKKDYCS